MKIENKSRFKWTAECIAYLLEVWLKYSEQLRGTRKNTHVYSDMNSEMKKRGVVVTSKEIRDKVNNMARKYRDEQKKLGTGSSPSQWEYYEPVNKIIGGYPCNSLEDLEGTDAFDLSSPPLGRSPSFDSAHFLDEFQSPEPVEFVDSSSAERAPPLSTSTSAATREKSLPSRKRRQDKLSFQSEVLQQMKISNAMLEKELSAHRKLTEEIAKKDEDFQREAIKFQNQFLEILKKK